MKYLLDTDTLSNLLKKAPSVMLIARLAAVPIEEQATSSITVGEMAFGAYRSGERAAFLLGQIRNRLLPNLTVLPFDGAAAWRYGDIRAELERRGTPTGDSDLRIGAIALVHGLTVVTGNVRHFGRISTLKVENWLDV